MDYVKAFNVGLLVLIILLGLLVGLPVPSEARESTTGALVKCEASVRLSASQCKWAGEYVVERFGSGGLNGDSIIEIRTEALFVACETVVDRRASETPDVWGIPCPRESIFFWWL